MTLWLVHKASRAWMTQHRGGTKRTLPDGSVEHRVDLSSGPAPAVMAGGVCGCSCVQVWLEGDGVEPEPGTAKPPWRVPTLEEIRAIEPNGLVAVSTFSGAGGSSTGYEIAGYRVAWANEFEPNAADTYAANHPGAVLDRRDIRMVTGAEILEAAGVDEVDLLDGSPPCQTFSMAGKRQDSWGKVMDHADGTRQRSDDLFFEFARLLGELQPRAFVAENVAGLVAGVAKGYFKEILAALRAQGYRVEARVLDAQWLGVPQARRRVALAGVREDLGLDPVLPSPLPYRYSIVDACAWLGKFGPRAELISDPSSPTYPITHRSLDEPTVTITTANAYHLTVPDGGPTEGPLEGTGPRTPRAQLHNRRPSVDEPAPTVLADKNGWSGIVVGRRRLTIDELKRLCSFPDDYQLSGTYAQQWARLGNSVPPLMAAAWARSMAGVLLASRPAPAPPA